MAQAQQLQIIKGRDPAAVLRLGDAQPGAGPLQALDSRDRVDALGKRQNAGRIDQQRCARELDIDHLVPLRVSMGVQAAMPIERRRTGQMVARPLRQKPRRLLGLLAHLLTQPSEPVGAAGQGAKVEEHAGLEQVFWAALLDPLGKACAPLRQRQATQGIGGHHTAGAQRITAGIERVVDVGGKGQPSRLVARRIAGLEDQGVVLVGGNRLFAPPL